MSKLPKAKRNQLILVVVVTLMVLSGFWFFVVSGQQSRLNALKDKRAAAEASLAQIRDTINNAAQIEAELVTVSNKLAQKEEEMASGDLYLSMVSAIRKFKLAYDVDIPQFNSDGKADNLSLLPRFPYKQVTLSVGGTAFYYDLGQFISEFENQFPSSRIQNLELSPISAQTPEDREKLAFRMEIVFLVKPN